MSTAEAESADESFEHIKVSIRTSFARLYAALKARELRTLRQLHAVRRQCETSHDHGAACLRSLRLSYDDEPNLLEHISRYRNLHLDNLNLDGDIFLVEDYICPDEDHMYSYKCIDELMTDKESDNESDIEEAALKQITNMEDCVCSVSLTPEEVSKQFREEPETTPALKPNENIPDSPNKSLSMIIDSPSESLSMNVDKLTSETSLIMEQKIEDKCRSTDETEKLSPGTEDPPKINPTEEWLNCIKSQIENEPTQVTDVMEHSTIVC